MGLREQLQWEDKVNAEQGLLSSYLNKRTPEQSAALLHKAKELRMTPEQAELITPEEDAERLTNKANIAGIQAYAPLLVEKMREPNFANVIRENLGNMGLLERTALSLAASPGNKPTTISQSAANGLTQGLFDLVTDRKEAVELKKQIDEINATDALLASGKTAQEVFADEEDPLGVVGMAEFSKRKAKLPGLQKQFEDALEKARYHEWRNQQYPVSDVTDKVFATGDDLGKAVSVLQDSGLYGFGQFLADTIPRSFISQLPAYAGVMVASAVGAPVAVSAGLMGLFSAAMDYESQVNENLKGAGVDFTNPRKAGQSMTSEAIKTAEEKAGAHATPVGLLDAVSLGVASKVLLPKALLTRWAEAPAKKSLANLAVQTPVGAALGGAGEAAGQIAAEGKINSWADVIAEIAGEGAMAPIEVASTAFEAKIEAKDKAIRADLSAEYAKRLTQTAQELTAKGVDSDLVLQHVDEVFDRAGLKTVSLDAKGLVESGADKLVDDAEVIKALPFAAQTGGSVEVSPSTAVKLISQNPDIAGLLSFNGMPSQEEARAQDAEVDSAAARELAEAQGRQNETFKAELVAIGEEVGQRTLKASGSREEAQSLQTIVQTFFGAMAHDLGASPKELWERMGARILGEPDVVRDAKGNLVSVEGKNPNVWADDAFSQSWGKFEKVKSLIVRGGELLYKLAPATREEVETRLKGLIGTELKFADGSVANFSKASLRKMTSGKAVAKSTNAGVHNFVLSNLEKVASKAIHGWTKPDTKSAGNLGGVLRYFSAIEYDGSSYLAKITVKSYKDPKTKNKAYSVESVEVKNLEGAQAWLEESAKADGYEKPAETETSTAGGALTTEKAPTLTTTVPQVNPELQDLVEALFKFKDGSFSQASKGDFYPTLRLIVRWKNADRSTLLHETGHTFLEARLQLYAELLKRGITTAGEKHFAESTEKLLKFLGVKSVEQWQAMDHNQRRKGHERFARSFEAWLMEGKAPKEDLVPVFARFKEWLKKIYITLSGIPGAKFDDSVQDMFANLFLAEAQIREAKIRQAAHPMFKSAEEAGMAPEEFESYHQSFEECVASAEAEQTERNRRMSERVNAMRRRAFNEIKKGAKGLLKQIRDEEEKAYKATRAYKAWDKIRNGVEIGEKKLWYKLPVPELEKMGATKTQIEKLKSAHLAVEQKRSGMLPLEDLAVNLGYDSALSMVADLLDNLDPKAVIDERSVDRFMKENPEIATPEKIQDAAATSIYNSARTKMLKAEYRAMAKLGKTVAKEINEAGFRALAAKYLSAMKYSEIKPQTYINAARKARREAQKLFAEGKIEEALRAKSNEICQSEFAKLAKELLTERSKTIGKFDKFKKPKNRAVHQGCWETIQRALVNMGFSTETKMKLNPEEKPFTFVVSELEAKVGHDWTSQYPDVLSAISRGDRRLLETPRGFNDFVNLLSDVEKAGREEMKIELAGKKAELEDIQAQGSEIIRAVADKHKRYKRDWRERSGWRERLKNNLERFGLAQARASSLMAVLDGGFDGLLTELVIHRYDKCANKFAEFQNAYAVSINNALSSIEKELRSGKEKESKVFAGYKFTTQDAFVMLLNYGNEGNIQRLAATIKHHFGEDILGQFDAKDSAAVQSAYARADEIMGRFFTEQLDERFFEAAERVWATFDKVKAETESTLKRMGERTPVWVQSREFSIGERRMTGGYYPIVYDSKATLAGMKSSAVTDAKSMSGALFSNEGVADGHTQARLRTFSRPIVLTTKALFSGLNEQLYFCAYAEYINDMRKLFNPNGELSKAIHERYGSNFFNAIDEWLRDVRENGKHKASAGDEIANFLRKGVSIAGIGFNLGVAAIQVVGFTQSAAYLGSKWLIQGQLETLHLGTNANAWVCAKSSMMRDRTRTQFREVNEIYSKLNGASSTLDKIQQAAYVPVTAMQMIVDIPTWIGGYKKALAEGHSEEQAVALADRAVMNSQGSGRVGDLSAVERGGAWSKLFTVFYTFFNTALQLAVVSGKTNDTMKAAAKILTVCLVQPVMEYVLRELAGAALGQDDEDDDDDFWLKHTKGAASATFSFNMSMFFGVREFASAMGDYQYRGPTGLRKVVDFGKAAKSAEGILFEDKDFTESALRNFISAFGSFSGIPVSPINKAIKGYNLIEDGKSDSYFSLVTGK